MKLESIVVDGDAEVGRLDTWYLEDKLYLIIGFRQESLSCRSVVQMGVWIVSRRTEGQNHLVSIANRGEMVVSRGKGVTWKKKDRPHCDHHYQENRQSPTLPTTHANADRQTSPRIHRRT